MIVTFPRCPELSGREYGGIAETIIVTVARIVCLVGRYGELYGGEERGNEVYLVAQLLFYSFLYGDDATLQFNDCQGYAVDIHHNVRTTVATRQRVYETDLFGYGETVGLRIGEVEQIDILMFLFG